MKKIIIITLLLLPDLLHAEEPAIIINEISWMGTTVSANDEWLELYNPTTEDIDLTGWSLVAADGSPEIELAGTIPADGYFLLERTDDDSVPGVAADQIYSGALGNNGEWLKLNDKSNRLVDEINATDGWPAGDNVTKQTLEKAGDQWQTSPQINGSPKAQNSTEPANQPEKETGETNTDQEESAPAQPASQTVQKQDIIINEVFPDPAGLDTAQEFIELKNISRHDIDLTDWRLATAKQNFTLPSLKMTPQSLVVFYRIQTKLALNNDQEKITLYATDKKIIDRVEYKNPAPTGQSYQRTSELDLAWDLISPGKANVVQKQILPVANFKSPKEAGVNEFIDFDASDSFDPANRDLNFFWDFGDGRTAQGVAARQIYAQPGTYQITLKTVTADQASSTQQFKIKIIGPPIPTATSTPTTTVESIISHEEETPFIFLSEFLPDPSGDDTDQEFIELFSDHPVPVDLGGWQLDDADGGSKAFTIPDETIIKPGQYLALTRGQTKIALNNNQDAVRLFSPAGLMVDYVEYDDSSENKSLVRDETFSWQETDTPTPNEINVLNQAKATAELPPGATGTPQILGSNSEPAQPIKNNQRYLISIVSAFGVILVGAGIKLFKK